MLWTFVCLAYDVSIDMNNVKVILFGKNSSQIKPLVEKAGFLITEKEPDFIVSYGGDGTHMMAEHAYPGIPKILLKDSLICKKCSPLANDVVLDRVANGKYHIEDLMKLEVSAHGKTLFAMNDVILHNKDSRHAIRYCPVVQGRSLGGEVIGDGVVVATPFGSTAYYRSITDSFFELGIGLAFNNSTEQSDHVVLKEDSVINITIARGHATVYADNQAEEIAVAQGSEIVIHKSNKRAHIVVPDLI